MVKTNGDKYWIALDAGGTMTDTFLSDIDGRFWIGKALTNSEEEYRSYLASVSDASKLAGSNSKEVHKKAYTSVYAGTTVLNVVLTQSGLKIGLLATKGFETTPFQDRSLTWLGKSYEDTVHLALHEHPPAMIQYNMCKPVIERIKGASWYVGMHVPPGSIVVPLNESDVEKGTKELIDQGAEVIAIWFINSYANPVHERRAAEIAKKVIHQRGVDIQVATSSEICPLSFENERLKTLLLYCYCAVPTRRQLKKVESKAQDEGFKYKLETYLSFGGRADIDYPRLNEAIISGPAGGIAGVNSLLVQMRGIKNVIGCDLGGTTFDVGIISDGVVSIDSDPDVADHRARMPMVSVESIGAGAGTQIHVDPALKRITLGPESAGAKVGVCYKYPNITVSDVNVSLGYLNPDNFLGGAVKLNKKAALEALTEKLAKPLGMDVYEAGAKVIELLHSKLKEHLMAMLLVRGKSPVDYSLINYGGAGPLHLWGLETKPAFDKVCTVPWAAAFSAFGIAMSDRFYRYDKTVIAVLPAGVPDEVRLNLASCELNPAWKELGEKAILELTTAGIKKQDITFEYAAEARYLGQMISWPFPVDKPKVETIDDVQKLITSFEKAYLGIYPEAARFPEAGYAITGVTCKALIPTIKPIIPEYELRGEKPPKAASKGQRDAYFGGKWIKTDIWEMDLLEAGNRVNGPAILEQPMTTFVIPPGRYIEMDKNKIMWYKIGRN